MAARLLPPWRWLPNSAWALGRSLQVARKGALTNLQGVPSGQGSAERTEQGIDRPRCLHAGSQPAWWGCRPPSPGLPVLLKSGHRNEQFLTLHSRNFAAASGATAAVAEGRGGISTATAVGNAGGAITGGQPSGSEITAGPGLHGTTESQTSSSKKRKGKGKSRHGSQALPSAQTASGTQAAEEGSAQSAVVDMEQIRRALKKRKKSKTKEGSADSSRAVVGAEPGGAAVSEAAVRAQGRAEEASAPEKEKQDLKVHCMLTKQALHSAIQPRTPSKHHGPSSNIKPCTRAASVCGATHGDAEDNRCCLCCAVDPETGFQAP